MTSLARTLRCCPLFVLMLAACGTRPTAEPAPAASTTAALTTTSAPTSTGDGRLPPGRAREMFGGSSAILFPLERVEDEPKRFPQGSAAIPGAADFVFVLGQGSNWHGFDTLKIDASGQAEIVYGGQGGGKWRRATFRLTPEELRGLQGELVAIDIYSMKRGYFAAVDDGTQWFVRVQAAGQRKTVVLDNHFPEPIVRLSEHVRTRILPPHQAEIDAAVEQPALKAREAPRWDEDMPPRR